MSLAFLPLIAVVLIAIAWIAHNKRSRHETVASVAQFSRALTALAPPAPRDPDLSPQE